MYDILIVDDDPIIRQGLCRIIEGFEERGILYQAGNGIEALDRICLGNIGLVFADIKMPICNGLELLQKLTDIDYRGEVVMISGFDDFEFVRMAMRLGASDYMLKPISSEELQAVYHDALQRLTRKQMDGINTRDLPKVLLEKIYTEQAWLDRLQSKPEAFADFLRDYSLPRNAQIAVCLFSAFGKGSISERDRQAAYLLGTSMLHELDMPGKSAMLQGLYKQQWAAIVFFLSGKTSDISRRMAAYCQREGISFGIAQREDLCNPFASVLEEALRGLENFFYDMSGTPSSGQEARSLEEMADQSATLIAACKTMEALASLQQLFDRICGLRPSVEEVKRLLVSIIYALMRKNKEFIGVIGKFKFTDLDIVLMVQAETTVSGLRKQYISLIQAYVDALDLRRLSRDDYAILKAKSYLENGYQGSLSLSEIANRLGLNPNYLSSLFHQKTGKTFSEYTRDTRIEKAIEMMSSTNLKMFEIALAVGYSDSAQFHRAFKQATGASPGVYKRRRLE